jgi:hypothetical protein
MTRGSGRSVVLVIGMLEEGDCIAGEEVHARERKDLNRMRAIYVSPQAGG